MSHQTPPNPKRGPLSRKRKSRATRITRTPTAARTLTPKAPKKKRSLVEPCGYCRRPSTRFTCDQCARPVCVFCTTPGKVAAWGPVGDAVAPFAAELLGFKVEVTCYACDGNADHLSAEKCGMQVHIQDLERTIREERRKREALQIDADKWRYRPGGELIEQLFGETQQEVDTHNAEKSTDDEGSE